jgi:hypothetical protein
LIIVTLACLATDTRSQSLDSVLNNADKATLDLVALHMAQKIQEATLAEAKPEVLVIDFYRGSAGNSSRRFMSLKERPSD